MVQIVDYEAKYAEAFKQLNYEWINTYFEVEPSDLKALENPEEYVLDGGGAIVIALLEGEPVGTCALIKMDEKTYELAKMAVSPKAQGNKIGWKLGMAVIEKAKELGASTVYLETNSVLKPALSLYKKLGFTEGSHRVSPYNRCNVQMELPL